MASRPARTAACSAEAPSSPEAASGDAPFWSRHSATASWPSSHATRSGRDRRKAPSVSDAHGFDVGAARERRHRAGDVAARRRGRQRRVGIICSLDTRATAEPPPVLPLRLDERRLLGERRVWDGFRVRNGTRVRPGFVAGALRAFPPFPEPRLPQRVGVRVPPNLEDAHERAVFPGAHVQNARAHLGDVRAHLSVRAAALDAERHAEVQARPFGLRSAAIRACRVPGRRTHARQDGERVCAVFF